MKKTVAMLGILLFPSLVAGSSVRVVRHIRPESGKQAPLYDYYVELLRLALEKTVSDDGPFRLEMTNVAVRKGPAIRALEEDVGLDVMWLMTSTEREETLLPVRIPLLKGLLGYRVFIIRKRDTEKFRAVKTWEDLRRFKAGQGRAWQDVPILRANGIDVVEMPGYESLFFALRQGRFDYFPRGANEAWEEISLRPGMGLAVEETLLLHYRSPIYFFTNKTNTALADRLQRGLRVAIQDGSFDQVFLGHPTQRTMFREGRLKGRRIFRLENPLLPPETPLDRQELWLSESLFDNAPKP